MPNYTNAFSDATRKSAILATLTQAATEAGTQPGAMTGAIKGPLRVCDLSQNIAGLSHVETLRLVNELVDAGSVVRNQNGSADPNKWTYTAA